MYLSPGGLKVRTQSMTPCSSNAVRRFSFPVGASQSKRKVSRMWLVGLTRSARTTRSPARPTFQRKDGTLFFGRAPAQTRRLGVWVSSQ